MAITLPGQTLRGVAAKLRQLSYVPTSWQGVLAGLNADGRSQLETFLHDLVREGGSPQLMAMVLEHLADQREALQRERDAWSFVWSGPEGLHTKTADTFATASQLIKNAKSELLIATYNIGLSDDFREILQEIASRINTGSLQEVKLFFHPVQILSNLSANPKSDIKNWFETDIWPWEGKPRAFVDTRLIHGVKNFCCQHSKIIITDYRSNDASILTTSANFSEAGQRQNFEAGWLCRSSFRAHSVHEHFEKLISEKLFTEINV